MNTIKALRDRKAANARREEKKAGTTRKQLASKIAGCADVVELTKLADSGRPWVAKRAANKLAKLARDEEARIEAASAEANAQTTAQAKALAAEQAEEQVKQAEQQAKAKRSEAAKKAAATRKAKAAAKAV